MGYGAVGAVSAVRNGRQTAENTEQRVTVDVMRDEQVN